jgi:hypothetical protein
VGHNHDLGDLKTIISASPQSTPKESMMRQPAPPKVFLYFMVETKPINNLQRELTRSQKRKLIKKTVVYLIKQD